MSKNHKMGVVIAHIASKREVSSDSSKCIARAQTYKFVQGKTCIVNESTCHRIKIIFQIEKEVN